jgi:hypothetical protein
MWAGAPVDPNAFRSTLKLTRRWRGIEMTARADASGQLPPAPGAAIVRSGGTPAGVLSAAMRRELRCRGCGFGAIVAHPLARCPMCGGGDWQLIPALSAPDGARVVRW